MPCFKPLTQHMLEYISDWKKRYGLGSPVLDIGAGRGAFAGFFAQTGDKVSAVDLSYNEGDNLELQKKHPGVTFFNRNLRDICQAYQTLLLIDVLEHVDDDRAFLRQCYNRLYPGGFMILSVPVKQKEWGWDDHWYGHRRRYDPKELRQMLEQKGFSICEDIDVTFPVIWLMRRLYLTFYRFSGLAKKPEGSAHEQSLRSAEGSASGSGGFQDLVGNFPLWSLILRVQSLFKHNHLGCNRLYLLKKTHV